MAYLGLQSPGRPAIAATFSTRAFAAAGGPGHHDRAVHAGRAGPPRSCPIAYWDDPAAFDRWFAAHRESWLGDRARDGHGRWVEILRPTVEPSTRRCSPRSAGPRGWPVLADGIQRRGAGARLLGRHAGPDPALPDRPDGPAGRTGRRARRWPGPGAARPADLPDPLRPGLDRHRRRRAADVPRRRRAGAAGRAWTSCATRAARSAATATGTSPCLQDGRPVDRTFGLSWWRSLDALDAGPSRTPPTWRSSARR